MPNPPLPVRRPKSGERLLFMGDSITECMRETVEPPLGAGFVQLTYCMMAARHPELDLDFINVGIDGETVEDLERRWERDVLGQEPDHLFLMIGVNDVLYRAVRPDRAVDDERYEETLRRLLETTMQRLDCRITLMDPTPLEEDLNAPSHEHVRRLCAIVRRVADDFGVDHIPAFDRMLDAIAKAPDKGWMIDVPHPNLAGQSILALAVLEHLGW